MAREGYNNLTLPDQTHRKLVTIRDRLIKQNHGVGTISVPEVVNMLADYYEQRRKIGASNGQGTKG